MGILSLLSTLAAKAVKSFFIKKVASAVATLLPKKTLVAATLLGHTVKIGTREVAETLISEGLERLVDRASSLPAKVASYTDTSARIEYSGSGNSYDILRSVGAPRRVDVTVSKPQGLRLPQFPPLKKPSFPEFKPKKLSKPDW